jgi:hypothetical protein
MERNKSRVVMFSIEDPECVYSVDDFHLMKANRSNQTSLQAIVRISNFPL